MALRVFCDFDGTIVRQDVGDAFFRLFGGEAADRAIEDYRTGKLNARECLLAAVSSVQHVSRGEFERFVDQFSVDQTFGSFLSWCEARGASVMILSDGLDLYVNRILSAAGYDKLTVRANKGSFHPATDTGLAVSFPFRDEICEECAHCKRNQVVTSSADEDVVVYVGDGLSDRCSVEYADIVFARDPLIAWCQERNITYHTFKSFAEVQMRLNMLAERNALKQRREAAMARRALFQRG